MTENPTWNSVGTLVGGLISIAVTVVVVAITIVGFFRVRRWSVDFENRADAPSPPGRARDYDAR